MNLQQYARLTMREVRGSRRRLLLFIACLSVGVGAIVTVATLSASLDDGIRTEAKAILGGDVVVSSRRPLPEGGGDALLKNVRLSIPGPIQHTTVRELITIAAAPPRNDTPGTSRLVTLKAIDGEYPLYGELQLDPPHPLGELLSEDTAVVAPELLADLELEPDDELLIGGKQFRIAGTLLSEPRRLGLELPIGPRVLLSSEALARISSIGQGLGVESTTLFKLPVGATDADAAAFQKQIESKLPTDVRYRVSSYIEAQPRLRRNLNRITDFLGLVGLLSLLIGSVGVAQTVRAWIAERLDAIAVLRCLGMRPGEVVLLYAGQTALLGLVGSILGAVMGVGMAVVMTTVVLPDLIPPEFVNLWQPAAVAQGLALGVGVSLAFSFPPLMEIRVIPPARVFRANAEPLPFSPVFRIAMGFFLIASVWAAATWQSGSPIHGAIFTSGLLAVVALLTICALGLSAIVARLPRDRGRLWLRHGLARMARPGAATVSSIVAVGLGVMIVLTVHLVERHLTGQLSAELPDAPSCFLMNIRSDQMEGVQRILDEHNADSIHVVPIIRARISALNGVPAKELVEQRTAHESESPRGENRPRTWPLKREQRLTYYQTLPTSNQVIEGALWSVPDVHEISVEERFAKRLGVSLGSTITIDVSGSLYDLRVTSIRSVNWGTVSTNFFLVVEPGVLDDAPQMYVTSAKLPPGGDQLVQNALAVAHPNVALLQVRELAEKLLAVLQRVSIGVQLLGAFTVLAGILILAGAISASYVRRGREVALLKTLGMTRREIAALLAVEYAIVGIASSLIGGFAGGVLAWTVITELLDIPWEHQPLTYVCTVLLTIVLVVGAGLAASARAMAVRPIEVLRSQ